MTIVERKMELNEVEQEILRELVLGLRRDFGATNVLLYGSAARGQLDEHSDIDLLVVLPGLNWDVEKRVIECCFQAELRCRRVISTACFTPEELADSPLRVSPFVVSVRKEGIPL